MLNLQVERLKRLPPHANEVWQGGIVGMPGWVTGEGPRPFRPVTAMWARHASQAQTPAVFRRVLA